MTRRVLALLLIAMAGFAADRVAMPFSAARALLVEFAPNSLKSADARAFNEWVRGNDRKIRARLEQGDLDTLVNLLLFGTSYTEQPRMSVDQLAEQARSGLLRGRLADLMRGLQSPGDNERLAYLRELLVAKGMDPQEGSTGVYILDNLQRMLRERIEIEQRIAEQRSPNNVFGSRGVSLDTTIFPNYAIDAALAEVKAQNAISRIERVAVIGAGLDFIDKEAGFDYYPLQTLQPFAVQDSLARATLSSTPRVTILDISGQVLNHVKSARAKASKGEGYTIQLPRNAISWQPGISEYWERFGGAIARPVEPIPVPVTLPGVSTRAVEFPAAAVLRLDTEDVNIVGQRLNLKPSEQYDLVIATNILVYYERFEQALALANIAAMLRPGGLLLTTDDLPLSQSIPMKAAGRTEVVYTAVPPRGDSIFWYVRQ